MNLAMTPNTITRPKPTEYFEYFETYISKFVPKDFWADFDSQPAELESLLVNLPPGEDSKLHAPYTWTLKQVVGHVIDTERIFATRLLRIAVGDPTPNPDFEQNSYVAGLDYENVSINELIEEFATLRKSNSLLIRRLNDEQLSRTGTASGKELSARAIPFLMGGHFVYHFEIMKKRLGK